MKYIFLLSAVLISISLRAQDCSEELLKEKPGTWKAGTQGSIYDVTAADLAREKAVLARIHKMISSDYNPKGCQIAYSTMYGKHPQTAENWRADPYHYSMQLLMYFCNDNSPDKSTYSVSIASATSVNITANVIYSMNNLYAANLMEDDFRGYLILEDRPVKKDGFYYFGERMVGGGGIENKIIEYRWLITYNDTLPFSYVSRKEYLLIQRNRLEKSIKDNPSDNGYSNKFLNNINEYLTMPESELSKDAICMRNDEEQFVGFVEEGTPGSFIAVKPNLSYYKKNLPKSAPQFFTVIYKLAQGFPVYEENIEAIKEAIDFLTLKNMLGKN